MDRMGIHVRGTSRRSVSWPKLPWRPEGLKQTLMILAPAYLALGPFLGLETVFGRICLYITEVNSPELCTKVSAPVFMAYATAAR